MSLQIIDELKNCFNCNSLIRIPRVLPCGQSICSNCSINLANFYCKYCTKEHCLNDLVINQAHLKFLELISKLDSSSTFSNLSEDRHLLRNTQNKQINDNDNTANKINYLNNEFKYKIHNLTSILRFKTVHKVFKVLNQNTVLVVTEVFHGKINTTYLQLVENKKVIIETEINNHLISFFSCYVNDKYILVVFTNGKRMYYFHLFDFGLKLIIQKAFNFEINKIIMNESNIYIMSNEKKTYIREYGFELVKLAKFGQNKNQKRSFYIHGNVINVTSDKIFTNTNHESSVIVQSKGKGEVLLKFNVDDLNTSVVFLDKINNYLVFNGYSKLSLYNSNGELIATNKIRYPECFDEFQLTQSGHFAFINNSKNFIIVL